MANPTIQSAVNEGGNSFSVVFSSNNISGNAIVVCIFALSGVATGVTDTQGNTGPGGVAYEKIIGYTDGGNRDISIWWANDISAGSNTVNIVANNIGEEFTQATITEIPACSGIRVSNNATGSDDVIVSLASTLLGDICVSQLDTKPDGQISGTIGITEPTYPLANIYNDIAAFIGTSPGGTVDMTSADGAALWRAVAVALIPGVYNTSPISWIGT